MLLRIIPVGAAFMLIATGCFGQIAAIQQPREIPGYSLPVPDDISPEMRFALSPQTISPENQDRVFMHFHGGAYVLNPGEPGTREATLMAAFGRAKVISVDYRTSSDAPYPAALDDCVAVYRELLKTVPADKIAVFGTSTGGGLTMALVLRAKQEGLPLPAAIAPGSPWSDLTITGDTFYTHSRVDGDVPAAVELGREALPTLSR